MSLNIHIFIATSKGLVGIQSITELQDRELQSVITINGSTDLASISSAYHRFVQKSTGVIQVEFGGHSFRANISRNIDQGNSWQLPFYLAHFIQSNARDTHANQSASGAVEVDEPGIKLGQGIPRTGDIVLIATGQINTSTGAIGSVNHIPDKCITASAQIKLWMKKGILVEFFVPASRERTHDAVQQNLYQQATQFQPLKNNTPHILPEVDCAIYPVIDIHQLQEHVEQLLPSRSRHNDQSTNAVKVVPVSKRTEQLNDIPEESCITDSNSSIIPTKLAKLLLKIVPVVLISIILITYWAFNNKSVFTDTRFITTTKNGLYCDANALKQVSSIAQQYVSRIPAVVFGDACSMTLITAKQTPQVWLVADSKTLIELSSVAIDDEFHWTIPLPNKQNVDREYVLIVTNQYLDLADLAAFKSYLSRIEKTQKPSIEVLAPFFSQIDVNPQYISQQLVAAYN
ncbi:MAG: hypothetical protein ACI89W_000308 [Gammaproteobacteria bacterium]|jgi:hypothetical protein